MSKASSKAKGFKKSKSGTYLSIAHHRVRRRQRRQAGQAGPRRRATRCGWSTPPCPPRPSSPAWRILYRELKRLGDDDVLLG